MFRFTNIEGFNWLDYLNSESNHKNINKIYIVFMNSNTLLMKFQFVFQTIGLMMQRVLKHPALLLQ